MFPMLFQHHQPPDFSERFTLADGRTRAVAFPAAGYNCNGGQGKGSMAQKKDERYVPYVIPTSPALNLEHCPDFSERFTLADGRTRAVAFPAAGYNCNGGQGKGSLAQGGPEKETR